MRALAKSRTPSPAKNEVPKAAEETSGVAKAPEPAKEASAATNAFKAPSQNVVNSAADSVQSGDEQDLGPSRKRKLPTDLP